MIPSHTYAGVLPPFLPGASPSAPGFVSPYETDMVEFVSRFGTTPDRVRLLRGLLAYREELSSVGVVSGFQWVDGSFVEDVEAAEDRSPADIDVVTFGTIRSGINKTLLLSSCPHLFDPVEAKNHFGCDAYFVDMTQSTEMVHLQSCYWLNLFSHRRATQEWKGLLRINLFSNDVLASASIGGVP